LKSTNPVEGHPPLRRPRWLCIAYAFPPINRSGTHRTLAFVKDLDRLGWDATVVTATADGEPVDDSLRTRIPASATVMRLPWTDLVQRVKNLCPQVSRSNVSHRRAVANGSMQAHSHDQPARQETLENLREWCSRWLVTPDSRIGWIGPALRAGYRAIRRCPPDVIYSTSPYMSAHIVAMSLARWCRLPWVADFRDPWRDSPFRVKGPRTVEAWDELLEWSVLRSARHVICNTPAMTRRLCARRPFVAPKCSTILNGFDASLLRGIEPIRVASSDEFVLTHAGQFYGPRSPIPWFRAIRWALERTPALAPKLRVVLIGPERLDGRHLSDIARDAGIHHNIMVLGQKAHREALGYLAGSDALLLAGSSGSGDDLQIPNKLFEYLAIRKPIIASCSPTGSIARILRDARAKALVCHPNDEVGLTDAIVKLATQGERTLRGDWSGIDQFARWNRSNELLGVFQRVMRGRPHETDPVVTSASGPASALCSCLRHPTESGKEHRSSPSARLMPAPVSL